MNRLAVYARLDAMAAPGTPSAGIRSKSPQTVTASVATEIQVLTMGLPWLKT
jgi:hypothetical protein